MLLLAAAAGAFTVRTGTTDYVTHLLLDMTLSIDDEPPYTYHANLPRMVHPPDDITTKQWRPKFDAIMEEHFARIAAGFDRAIADKDVEHAYKLVCAAVDQALAAAIGFPPQRRPEAEAQLSSRRNWLPSGKSSRPMLINTPSTQP